MQHKQAGEKGSPASILVHWDVVSQGLVDWETTDRGLGKPSQLLYCLAHTMFLSSTEGQLPKASKLINCHAS